jgi:hypothetical protein
MHSAGFVYVLYTHGSDHANILKIKNVAVVS